MMITTGPIRGFLVISLLCIGLVILFSHYSPANRNKRQDLEEKWAKMTEAEADAEAASKSVSLREIASVNDRDFQQLHLQQQQQRQEGGGDTEEEGEEEQEQERLPSLYVEKQPLNVILYPRVFEISVYQSTMMLLFEEIQRPLRYIVVPDLKTVPKEEWPVFSDAIFIPFGNKMMEIKADEYFEHIKAQGARNLGVLHLSDEVCASETEFYHIVDYVIRRYYCPRAFQNFPRTLWFPNGWADGVGPKDSATLLVSSERKMPCFFKGRKTTHRAEFVDTMEAIGADCFMDFSEGYGKGDARPAYSAFLGDAKFAPCPAGNSPETIRFYDSLENGAIPVVLQSKFTKYMLVYEGVQTAAELPFLVLEDWGQFNDAVKPYLDDPAKLNALQARTLSFWNRMKKRTNDGVRQLVDDAFKSSRSM